jgi:DNA-binding PadR family transcriptional regulator
VEWQNQLVRVDADVCAYRVALYLLWEVWRSRVNQVKLANVGLKELGVGRQGKYNALHQLEEAGLISVKREPRKSPVVTVKYTD